MWINHSIQQRSGTLPPPSLANSTNGGLHWMVLKHEKKKIDLYSGIMCLQFSQKIIYLAKLPNAGVPGCLTAVRLYSLNPCILTKRQTQFLYWKISQKPQDLPCHKTDWGSYHRRQVSGTIKGWPLAIPLINYFVWFSKMVGKFTFSWETSG